MIRFERKSRQDLLFYADIYFCRSWIVFVMPEKGYQILMFLI